MEGMLPAEVTSERIRRLIDLQERLQQETLQRFVGTEEEILHLDGSEFMRKSNFCDGKIYYILMNEDEYELWRLDPDDFDREYVAALGSAKDSLISFCVFPGYDYGCIYLLKKGKAGSLTPVGEKYFLDP